MGSGFLCPRCDEHMSYDNTNGCGRCGLMCMYAPGEGVITTIGRREAMLGCQSGGIVGGALSKGVVDSMVDSMVVIGRKRQSRGDSKSRAKESTSPCNKTGKITVADDNNDVEMTHDGNIDGSTTSQKIDISSSSLEPRRSLRKSQPPPSAFPMLSECDHNNNMEAGNDAFSSSNDIGSQKIQNTCGGGGGNDNNLEVKILEEGAHFVPQQLSAQLEMQAPNQKDEDNGMSKGPAALASSFSNDGESVLVILDGKPYSKKRLVSVQPVFNNTDESLIHADVEKCKAHPLSQGQQQENGSNEPLAPPNPLPPFPATYDCRWTYDETSRVLLAKFHSDSRIINPIDEIFLLKMMERDDITVVSEGLADRFDTNLWNLEYIDRCVGESYYHKIRVFNQVDIADDDKGEDTNDADEGDYEDMWGEKKESEGMKKCKINRITHKEQNGFQSMKIRDYISYLKRRQAVLLQNNTKEPDVYAVLGIDSDDSVIDPMFHFTPFDGSEKAIHVVDSVLYLIDFDLMKLLPVLYENMVKSFRLPGLLPGGIHCMMNLVPTSARPFMGPNLYMTPPGSFTHFHQDGYGTVDSGHQCLAGYNEVVMLRRMSNDRKHHSLEILNGNAGRDDKRLYDALYGEPHSDANGEKPPWPSPEAIEECRRMNYCPSVFILKPGQFVHINKGRIHAFRKMTTASLPASDCHSHLRKALIEEENITGEVTCLSIAWDWMYRGYTTVGMNDELEGALLCAKLNQEHAKLSLAITETSILHSALVMVSQFEQARSEDKPEGENIIPLAFCTSPLVRTVPSPIVILKGIQPSLQRMVEGHEEALANVERCRIRSVAQQITILSTPNAYQNPHIAGSVDAYGDGYFCKLCNHELSNTYMQCDGCEELLHEDFNICTDCYSQEKYKIFHQMHRDNNERDCFVNHTGDMSTATIVPPCECSKIARCEKCLHCSGCKCTCHSSFTLNFRFMSIGEEKDLVYRVNTAIVQSSMLDDGKARLMPARSRYCSRLLKDLNAPKANACAFSLYKNSVKEQPHRENLRELSKYTSQMYTNLTVEEKEKWGTKALEDEARFINQMKSYIPRHGYDAQGYLLEGYHPEYEPSNDQSSIKGVKQVNKGNTDNQGNKVRKGNTYKDPNAPTRPPSQVELYQRALTNYYPGMTVIDRKRYLSQMYKDLTKEEQLPWETRAHESRARYTDLKKSYNPPKGYNSKGYRFDGYEPAIKPAKKIKEPDAPQFPLNAFTFFAIEMRPKVIAKYPKKEMKAIVKIINMRWNNKNPEERQKFTDMQTDDIKRFKKENRKYNEQKTGSLAKLRVKTKAPNVTSREYAEQPMNFSI